MQWGRGNPFAALASLAKHAEPAETSKAVAAVVSAKGASAATPTARYAWHHGAGQHTSLHTNACTCQYPQLLMDIFNQ